MHRQQLEKHYAEHLARRLKSAQKKRAAVPGGDQRRVWPLSFAGRPVEFIGEIMGPEWWTDDWAGWRAFVAALFGLEIGSDEALERFRRFTGRNESPQKRQREAWLAIGRRGGKSRTLALIGVYLACCEDWRENLAPGELGFIRVLANNRPNAHAIMGYTKAALRHPKLVPLVVKELAESVELLGSVAIEVGTASIGAVRARTIVAALCDEIAFWEADEESANPDREILNALRPAMLTVPRGMVLAASSVYARKGVLWDAYRQWYGRDDSPLVMKAATWDMHPTVDRTDIDRAYEEDPIAAGAEYGSEFRTDITAFVTVEAYDGCRVAGRHELSPESGIEYHAFVDPSGGSADSMTLAISHRLSDGSVVLDAIREAKPPFSPDSIVSEFCDLLRSYGVSRVRGDFYGGLWPTERFEKHGVIYEPAEDNKSEIYQAWLPLLNAGRCELLDDRTLQNQALNLERRVTRGGRDRIDHPPGSHDDVINAAAGALVMASEARYPALWAMDDIREVA